MHLKNIGLFILMFISSIQSSFAEKSLALDTFFKPTLQNESLLGVGSIDYTFSGSSADTINYIQLCKATDNTCSICGVPYTTITSGTPLPYSTGGTNYRISPSSVQAYLSTNGFASGTYYIGMYVQSTNFKCPSSTPTAYCSASKDSSTSPLCMQVVYVGSSVTELTRLDNGNVLLNTLASPYAYVTAQDNTISKCPVNADGSLGTCVSAGNTGATVNGPWSIAVNPSNTMAYIANLAGNNILGCPITATGSMGACFTALTGLNNPQGIYINAAGTFAYVANTVANTVLKCPIKTDGTFDTCSSTGTIPGLSTPFAFQGPHGIMINPLGTSAYVANADNSTVTWCSVTADGSFTNCINTVTTGLSAPIGLVINSAGTIAYIDNHTGNSVMKCSIGGDGSLSSCVNAGNSSGVAFNNPYYMALNISGTVLYVVNYNAANDGHGALLYCPINSADGTIGNCVTASAFTHPLGVALASVR